MDFALAMIEYSTVSSGIKAMDLLVKTAYISVLFARTICPGKYIVLFKGELASVKVALTACEKNFSDGFIGKFVLGNPHESVYEALQGKKDFSNIGALGILETKTVSSAIIAADITAKSAVIKLLEIRLGNAMGGKAYVMFTGTIAAVEEAIEICVKKLLLEESLIDYALIPNPNEDFIKAFTNDI